MVAVAAMEKIEVAKRKRDDDRKQAYLNLVLDVLDGREPDPELAADILEAAGKTETDLERAVSKLRRWRELQRENETFPGILAERDAVLGQLQAEAARLEQIHAEYNARVLPMHRLVETLNQQLMREHEVRRKLLDICPNPQLVSRFNRLSNDLHANGRRVAALLSKHDTLTAGASTERSFRGQTPQAVAFEADAAKLGTQIAELRAEEARLQTEIRETMEAMLKA
jgi:hypothetical protein